MGHFADIEIFPKKSYKAKTRNKSVRGGRGFSITCWIKIFFKSKNFYSTENPTLKLYIGRKFCESLGKSRYRYPNYENVTSEFMYVLDVMYVLRKLSAG